MMMIVLIITFQSLNMVHKKNTFIIAWLIEETTNQQINKTKPLDLREKEEYPQKNLSEHSSENKLNPQNALKPQIKYWMHCSEAGAKLPLQEHWSLQNLLLDRHAMGYKCSLTKR